MSDKKNWVRVTIESKFYGSRTSVTEQSNLTPEKGEDALTPQNFVYYPLSKALSSFVSARLREELVEYGKEELARRDTITDLVEEMIEILDGYSLIDQKKLSKLLKFLSRENSPVKSKSKMNDYKLAAQAALQTANNLLPQIISSDDETELLADQLENALYEIHQTARRIIKGTSPGPYKSSCTVENINFG